MKNLRFILLALCLIVLESCDKKSEKPSGKYASGVFVVNEGNLGTSNGEISFYSPSSKTVEENIFFGVNTPSKLGEIAQSMTIVGNDAYLVVNNSNKVEVVNANTFVSEHTITGLSWPRYFTSFDGKGYVTEWVSFTDPGRVSVIDLQAATVTTTIPVDYGPENIIVANSEIYVANNFSNTVFVIDPSKNQVTDTIVVNNGPGGFVIDKENKLWVVCGGGYGLEGPLPDGSLTRINTTTHTVEKTILLAAHLSAKVATNSAKDKLFYFDDTHVYVVGIDATEKAVTPFITEAAAVGFYGIGVDPSTDIVYVGDALGFVASGTVFRYSAAGAAIDNFTAGVAPNGFVFK